MGQWGPAVLSTGVAVKMWGWWPGAGFGRGGLVFKDGKGWSFLERRPYSLVLRGNTGIFSLRLNDSGTLLAEAARTRLHLEEVPGVRLEKADSEFIFKPKWAPRLPGRSRWLLGRIEIGIWSDTCQEARRLPSGQGFRLAEGQECA